MMKVLQKVQQLEVFKPIVNAINMWTSSASPATTPRTRDALLDSGATHILRRPRSDEEWDEAKEVSVQLAGDSSVYMKQTEDGTSSVRRRAGPDHRSPRQGDLHTGLPASLDQGPV